MTHSYIFDKYCQIETTCFTQNENSVSFHLPELAWLDHLLEFGNVIILIKTSIGLGTDFCETCFLK